MRAAMTSRQRWILVTALVSQAFGVGLTHGIFPVLLEPIEESFSAPRTLVSAGAVLLMLALTLSSLATGLLFDRGHARRVMWAGAALLSAGLALAAIAPNLAVLGIAAVLMGMAVPSIGPLSGATLVTRFFAEERGRALGWIGMGPPLGAGLLAALAAYLIAASDWRTTLLVFSGLVLLVLGPLVFIAIPVRFEARAQAAPAPAMSAVLRSGVFWGTAAMFALAAGIATGWTTHFVAYLRGQGLDTAERAGLLSAQFWMAVPASFAFGLLGDRFRPARMLYVILAGQGLVLLLYSGLIVEAPLPHALVIALGCASGLLSGGLVPLFLLLLGRRVDPSSFSRALGLSNLLMLPVLAGSVLLSAYCFERQGSYQSALVALAAAHVAAIVCLALSNRGGVKT
jgi:predicted MFS family arabinose efflux permease